MKNKNDMEIWRPIKDWPFYKVSNHGRIKSLNKVTYTKGKQTITPGRILKPGMAGTRNLVVCFKSTARKVKKTFYVKRLVASEFVPNETPETRKFVVHIDGNPENNHFENLKWVTQKEQTIHYKNIGLIAQRQGSDYSRKLDENKVIKIRALNGIMPHREIAAKFGISHRHVAAVMAYEVWRHVK